jgi:hypothetical protein
VCGMAVSFLSSSDLVSNAIHRSTPAEISKLIEIN